MCALSVHSSPSTPRSAHMRMSRDRLRSRSRSVVRQPSSRVYVVASSSSYSRSPRSAHIQGIVSFQTVVSFFFWRGKHTFSPTHARTPLTEPSVASTRSKVCSHMHQQQQTTQQKKKLLAVQDVRIYYNTSNTEFVCVCVCEWRLTDRGISETHLRT